MEENSDHFKKMDLDVFTYLVFIFDLFSLLLSSLNSKTWLSMLIYLLDVSCMSLTLY